MASVVVVTGRTGAVVVVVGGTRGSVVTGDGSAIVVEVTAVAACDEVHAAVMIAIAAKSVRQCRDIERTVQSWSVAWLPPDTRR